MFLLKWLFIPILLISTNVWSAESTDLSIKNGTLNLTNQINFETIGLTGEVEFYWNELLYPNDFDKPRTNAIDYIYIPSIWNSHTINGKKLPGQGYATYRFQIVQNKLFKTISIKIGSTGTACKLFVDDALVYTAGKVGKTKEESIPGYSPGIITFNTNKDTVQVVFQVSNFHYSKGGIWNNFSKIGRTASITSSWNSGIQFSLLLIGAILIIAFYHIGLYVLNRNFKYTLNFSLFCIVIVIRILSINETYLLELFPNLQWDILIKLEYLTLVVGTIVFSSFIYQFFNEVYSSKFYKALMVFSSLQLLIVLVTEPLFFTKLLWLFQVNILIASAYIVWMAIDAIRKGNKFAMILLSGFIILLITIINDILYTQKLIESTFLTQLGFIAFILSQAFMVSARFSRLFIHAESLASRLEITNQNLEELVERRTSKIREQNDLLVEQSIDIKEKNGVLEAQNHEIKSQRDYLQTQNIIVSKQKRLITSSIEYASRIQSAVIDTANEISVVAPDNFILFHPKDIVSGDFYWFKEIIINDKRYKIFTVVDCTGHGVPGAFMSILGALFLNKVVSEFTDAPSAAEILNKMRIEIKTLLQQNALQKSIKDGMDMALVIIDYDTMQIQYAGAHNPLYIIRKQQGALASEIEEYKGDNMPIGYYIKERESFTNHFIKINKGDLIYLFSDGYYDQFGGEYGKKFKKINFKKLLTNHANLPLGQQKLMLEKNILKWRGDYDQIDDMTVVGVRI